MFVGFKQSLLRGVRIPHPAGGRPRQSESKPGKERFPGIR
jgi:hypothetical protein